MPLQNVLYFLMWAGIFFFMMRLGCGAHVMGHGNRHGGSSDPGAKPPDQTVDPVCGMTIGTKDAKTAAYGGRIFYFCSTNCRDKFEAAPDTYAKNASTPHEGHHHGC